MHAPRSLFAITAPGLEPLAERELRALGVDGVRIEAGGVAFEGGLDALYAANLELRVASRVIVRVAEFDATSFRELEKHARRIDWARFVAPGRAVRFRVTCRKSRLYHSDAVAERFAAAVERVAGGAVAGDADADDEDSSGSDAQLFVVRLFHDRCTVSADSSGALLHLRGYRQAVAKAPLRETLAAAMLLGADWNPAAPLLDPMCGSGTIAIEAALLARRIAPGRARRFAFMHWPEHEEPRWRERLVRAEDNVLPAALAPIVASDRDAGAIDAARANAERAGVPDDIAFSVRPLSAIEPPSAPGWLVTNPPYGIRVSDPDRVRNLYAALGQVARAKLPGWTVALLSAEQALDRQLRLPLEQRFRTTNGGIPVRLMAGVV